MSCNVTTWSDVVVATAITIFIEEELCVTESTCRSERTARVLGNYLRRTWVGSSCNSICTSVWYISVLSSKSSIGRIWLISSVIVRPSFNRQSFHPNITIAQLCNVVVNGRRECWWIVGILGGGETLQYPCGQPLKQHAATTNRNML